MNVLSYLQSLGPRLGASLAHFGQFRSQKGVRNWLRTSSKSVSTFDDINVRIGGSSTLQFQALSHENSDAAPLKEIGSNFNLATANLDLDVVLYDGVRMHLRTYLSSRHHPCLQRKS